MSDLVLVCMTFSRLTSAIAILLEASSHAVICTTKDD